MIGNQGYLALKKQASASAAVTPDVFVPFTEETLTTNLNLDENNLVYGNKFARLNVLPGQRGHVGDVTVMAEPNTSHLFWDMAGVPMTVSGSGPSTWSGAVTNTTEGGSYTVDLCDGEKVSRFVGVQASSISPAYDANRMHWSLSLAALKAFHGAEVASVSTVTVTLTTEYDPAPTAGLVAGDEVQVVTSAGVKTSFTIDSLTATTVTLDESPTTTAGDMLVLQPLDVDLSGLTAVQFLWSRTEFRIAATASSALSATHTPLEPDTSWTFNYPFSEDEGAKRSGSLDPAALLRTNYDVEMTLRKFATGTVDLKRFIGLETFAMVVRCFSGASHEFRLTLNSLQLRGGGDKPAVSSGTVNYYELPLVPTYNQSDGQALDVKVLNGVAS